MEYLVLALWCFVIALAGGVAGLVLGALRLPLLLVLIDDPAVAAATNIAISAFAIAVAAAVQIQAKNVPWRIVWLLSGPSLLGGLIGGFLSNETDRRVLMIFIAVVMLGISIQLSYSAFKHAEYQRRPTNDRLGSLFGAAFVIGVLGGLIGLVLGSLRAPAMLRFWSGGIRQVIGANLVLGVIVGLAGVIGHAPGGGLSVGYFVVGSAGSLPGAIIGSRLVGKLDEKKLTLILASILLVVSLVVGIEGLRN